ncbi:MAG: PKD domain-containing protein [Candidatus Tectomicrobia bacterium]|nr:PKD domain-containing protein [Candidatus Tectomicrobia bacterium]
MAFRRLRFHRATVGILSVVGLLAAGCAVHKPPAFVELERAAKAIHEARNNSVGKRFPGELAVLRKQHQEARGVFYTCWDGKAYTLAQALNKRVKNLSERAQEPVAQALASTPANRPPRVGIRVPDTASVGAALQFGSVDPLDPDGDNLTYLWNFGDGTTSTLRNPSHQYDKPGIYRVQLIADDGRGGTATAMADVMILRQVVVYYNIARYRAPQDFARPESETELMTVAREMQEDPLLRAEIVSHACQGGTSARYNLRLSQQRARAMRDFLVAHGVSADRMIIDWKGDTQPVAENSTEEGRAKNRRTEMILRPLAVQ